MFQRITDPVLKSCKFCQGPVQKLVSMSSFHLKGSGWYVTDYGGKKPPAAESKKEDLPSPQAGETSTDSSSTTPSASSDD
jgi:hypothetical protein